MTQEFYLLPDDLSIHQIDAENYLNADFLIRNQGAFGPFETGKEASEKRLALYQQQAADLAAANARIAELEAERGDVLYTLVCTAVHEAGWPGDERSWYELRDPRGVVYGAGYTPKAALEDLEFEFEAPKPLEDDSAPDTHERGGLDPLSAEEDNELDPFANYRRVIGVLAHAEDLRDDAYEAEMEALFLLPVWGWGCVYDRVFDGDQGVQLQPVCDPEQPLPF